MFMKIYSTSQVAEAAGVNKSTLLRWLYAKEIPEPENNLKISGISHRLWSQEEADFVKAYKEQNYRKRS